MKAVLAPTTPIQSRTAWATNSGLFSLRKYIGGPLRMKRSVRASITSVKFSLRFARIARYSRLNSSSMLSVWNDETLSTIGSRALVECRHRFGSSLCHCSRRGCGVQPSDGCTIRRSARAGSSSAACAPPSIPPFSIAVLHNRYLPASQHLSAEQQRDDSRSCRISVPVRSCPLRDVLRLPVHTAETVVSSDIAPVPGRSGVPIPSSKL